jgi:hypothetical protein
MPNFTAVFFCEEDLDLAAITTKVQDSENQSGPLLAISPCEEIVAERLTCFTHEVADPPAKPIELRIYKDDVIPTVPGKKVVCIGNCFVAGEMRAVAAFR